MSCATLGTATINGAAGRCQCPEAAGTLQTALPATWNKRRLMRTQARDPADDRRDPQDGGPNARRASRPGQPARVDPAVGERPGRARDAARSTAARREERRRGQASGVWLVAGLSWPWSDLDRYLPHRACAAASSQKTAARRRFARSWAMARSSTPSPTRRQARSLPGWKRTIIKQTGALLKREGEGRNDGEKAVVYLRPWDSPELLSDVMGHPIAPATLAYYPAEDKIATNRPRENILRARSKNWSASPRFRRGGTADESAEDARVWD